MSELDETQRSSSLRQAVSDATARMQGIIDAADRAAAEIRADARTEADSYLAERRREADRVVAERSQEVARVAESLAASIEVFRTHFDSLSQELTGAASSLADLSEAPPEEPGAEAPATPAAVEPEPPVSPPTRVEPVPATAIPFESREEGAESVPSISRVPDPVATATVTETETKVSGSERKVPEEALLRATQMAIAGSGRAEIERVLEAEFNVTESSTVVDEILGSEAS